MESPRPIPGFLTSLSRTLRVSAAFGSLRVNSAIHRYAAGAWNSADLLAQASLVLAKSKTPLAAPQGTIARALWEGSVRLLWMAEDPEERIGRIQSSGADGQLKWIRSPLARRGRKGFDVPTRSAFAKALRNLRKQAGPRKGSVRAGPLHTRRVPDLAEQAKALKFRDWYDYVYVPLCGSVHWNSVTLGVELQSREDSLEMYLSVSAVHYWVCSMVCCRLLLGHAREFVSIRPRSAEKYLYMGHSVPWDNL